MILVVLGIIGGQTYLIASYYIKLVQRGELNPAWAFVILSVGLILAFMVVWSYLVCFATDPGLVPVGWHPFASHEQAQRALHALQLDPDHFGANDPRRPRYCHKCDQWKPVRAHHCSASGVCVLRMDHYCVWVANTVGLLNFKAFLLFLFYANWGCFVAALLLIKPTWHVMNLQKDDVCSTAARTTGTIMAFFFDIAFVLCLAIFQLMYRPLIRRNMTSVEDVTRDKPVPWPFDVGVKGNYEQVYGTSRVHRWFPAYRTAEKQYLLGLYTSNSKGLIDYDAMLQSQNMVSGSTTSGAQAFGGMYNFGESMLSPRSTTGIGTGTTYMGKGNSTQSYDTSPYTRDDSSARQVYGTGLAGRLAPRAALLGPDAGMGGRDSAASVTADSGFGDSHTGFGHTFGGNVVTQSETRDSAVDTQLVSISAGDGGKRQASNDCIVSIHSDYDVGGGGESSTRTGSTKEYGAARSSTVAGSSDGVGGAGSVDNTRMRSSTMHDSAVQNIVGVRSAVHEGTEYSTTEQGSTVHGSDVRGKSHSSVDLV